uniref:Uncharacterized protein n=1 Tax=Oryza nivara TaxID=4536 RepID=A0A0E0G5R3_ORYNI
MARLRPCHLPRSITPASSLSLATALALRPLSQEATKPASTTMVLPPSRTAPQRGFLVLVCPLVGDVGSGSEGSEEEHAAHLHRIWTPLSGDLSPQAAAFRSAPQQT